MMNLRLFCKKLQKQSIKMMRNLIQAALKTMKAAFIHSKINLINC